MQPIQNYLPPTTPPPSSGSASPPTPKPPECPTCKGRGFLVYDVPPGHPDFRKILPCTCTLAGKRRVMFAGDFANMTLDTFTPLTTAERAALRAAKETARRWVELPHDPPGGLLFYAPLQDRMVNLKGYDHALHVTGCGCGKTHLAVALARVAMEHRRDAKLVNESELLRGIRKSYNDADAPSEAELLDAVALPWLAVLDDVGTVEVKSVGWYQDLYYAIVNERYQRQLPLILTSNLNLEALAERLGPRVWSRLTGMVVPLILDGPDRRALPAL